MGKTKKTGTLARALTCFAATAAIALGTASPAFAADEEPDASVDIRVTVPTKISCALMPDGTVVSPSGLSIVNSGEAVVMDAYTADAMGNDVDFTLDVGGTRALTRAGGKDTAVKTGIDMDAGSTKGMALNVSKLTRQSDAALMDAAVNGNANMFELGFKFNVKRLLGSVAISSGQGTVGSELFSEVRGPVQEDAELAYQWYRVVAPPSDGVIYDGDSQASVSFAIAEGRSAILDVHPYPTGIVQDSSHLYIRKSDGEEVYDQILTGNDPPMLVSLDAGVYTLRYDARGKKPPRVVVSTDASSLAPTTAVIPDATSKTYVPTTDDLGNALIIKVTDSSGRYTGELTSRATDPIGQGELEGTVAVSGDPTVGSMLTASVTGAQKNAELTYQWYREGDPPQDAVIFDSDMVGSVDFSLKEDAWVTVLLHPTGQVDDWSQVTIRDSSGKELYSEAVNPQIGLSGGCSLPKGDYTFIYSRRGTHGMLCQVSTDRGALRGPMVPIPGATGKTYTVADSDAGKAIRCEVGDSSGGYSGTLTSDSVQIEKPREALRGNIYLLNSSGMNASAAHFGDQVSTQIYDVQADAVPYYRWYIDDVEVASGTKTYVPQYDDIGHALRLKISDSSGKYSGVVESFVMQVDDTFYTDGGLFRFSIPAQVSVGSTISIRVNDLTGRYGDAVFEYKWYKVKTNGYGDLLKGETGSSYKPTEGGTIRVSIRARFRGLVSNWESFDMIVDGNSQLDPYVVPKGDSDE